MILRSVRTIYYSKSREFYLALQKSAVPFVIVANFMFHRE